MSMFLSLELTGLAKENVLWSQGCPPGPAALLRGCLLNVSRTWSQNQAGIGSEGKIRQIERQERH